MVHRIETLLRSPLARLITLIAVLASFSCAVDSFEQFNKSGASGETVWFCETASDCIEGYRCDEKSKRCEEDINIACFDADSDKIFVGDDCLAAPEDQDCDDNNPLRNPLSIEKCDGVDNDCDEKVDDGIEPKSCPKFEGVCEELPEIPTYACVAGAQNSAQCETGCGQTAPTTDGACAYGPLFVRDEDGSVNRDICDGKDNDCDGQTDEKCPQCTPNIACGGNDCGNGVPADKCPCLATGTTECVNDQPVCKDSNGNTIPNFFDNDEVAGDGIDNNCDGNIDEAP